MRKCVLIFLCLALVAIPVNTETDARNEIEIKTVVKELTITNISSEDNSLVVVDGYYDSVSRVAPDSEETEDVKEFSIKLVDYQNAGEYQVGWKVEAICNYVEPKEHHSIKYFDCDAVPLKDFEHDVSIRGYLYHIIPESGNLVVESNRKYYRIVMAEGESIDELSTGDAIRINGHAVMNRPFLITEASYELLFPSGAYRRLHPCRTTEGNWYDGLFRVYTRGEYWQVNFRDDQPNQHLRDYMRFGIKGKLDPILEQTLHECVLFDIIEKTTLTGIVLDYYPGHGLIKIKKSNDQICWINVEMNPEGITNFKADDGIMAVGYDIPTRPDISMVFGQVELLPEGRILPVKFSGEVHGNDKCSSDGYIEILSGNKLWNVMLPKNVSCGRFKLGQWVTVDGSITSYSDRLIEAESLQNSGVSILAEIIKPNHQGSIMKVSDLLSLTTWLVSPNENNRGGYRRGTQYLIKGELDRSTPYKIKDASLTKLYKTKGKIVEMDNFNQQLHIITTTDRRMIVNVRPDWYNINRFRTGAWIEVTGIKTRDGINDAVIKWIE